MKKSKNPFLRKKIKNYKNIFLFLLGITLFSSMGHLAYAAVVGLTPSGDADWWGPKKLPPGGNIVTATFNSDWQSMNCIPWNSNAYIPPARDLPDDINWWTPKPSKPVEVVGPPPPRTYSEGKGTFSDSIQ